jgi:hypothetical protein
MRGMRKETRAGLQQTEQEPTNGNYSDQVFDRKVDLITAGLGPYHARCLRDEKQVSRHNAMIICDYILAMNIEVRRIVHYWDRLRSLNNNKKTSYIRFIK